MPQLINDICSSRSNSWVKWQACVCPRWCRPNLKDVPLLWASLRPIILLNLEQLSVYMQSPCQGQNQRFWHRVPPGCGPVSFPLWGWLPATGDPDNMFVFLPKVSSSLANQYQHKRTSWGWFSCFRLLSTSPHPQTSCLAPSLGSPTLAGVAPYSSSAT